MMTAWISGHAGLAILDDGNALVRFTVDGRADGEACTPRQLHALTSWGGGDVEEWSAACIEPGEVRGALSFAWRRDRALLLGLIALDPDMPEPVRRNACATASSLLDDGDVRDAVADRLYGAPFPKAYEPVDAGSSLGFLVAELEHARPAMESVHAAWRRVEGEALTDRAMANALRTAVTHRGGFRAATLSVLQERPQPLHSWTRSLGDVGTHDEQVFLRRWSDVVCSLGIDPAFRKRFSPRVMPARRGYFYQMFYAAGKLTGQTQVLLGTAGKPQIIGAAEDTQIGVVEWFDPDQGRGAVQFKGTGASVPLRASADHALDLKAGDELTVSLTASAPEFYPEPNGAAADPGIVAHAVLRA